MNNKSFSLKKILTMAIFALAMGQAWGALSDTTIAGKTYKKIGTCQDLKDFSSLVTSGQTSINAFVTDNIDCKDYAYTPIGGNQNPKTYTGTFDGNGKVITNLSITHGEGKEYYDGLIAKLGSGGVVKDVVIYDLTIVAASGQSNNDYVGGIVGYMDDGTIQTCTVAGSSEITARRKIGGIVGYAKSGLIEDCLSSVRLVAQGTGTSAFVGGICGQTESGVTIQSCVYVGGKIVRECVEGTGKCYNHTVDSAHADLSNQFAIAGGDATIKNCYYDSAINTPEHFNPYVHGNGADSTSNVNDPEIVCDLNGGTMVDGECYGGDKPWTTEPDITNHGGVHTDDDGTTYKIMFDPNGGVFGTDSSAKSFWFNANAPIKVDSLISAGILSNPSRTGDEFKGWALTSNDTTAASSYGNATGPTTFYAVWGKSVVITFDANGGKFPSKAVTTKRVNKGETITADGISTPSSPLAGIQFVGWALTSDATTTSALGTASTPITVYAVYAGEFTVSFQSNGGSFAAGATRTKSVKIGAAITADGIDVPNPPTEAYTFKGWSLDQNATAPGSLGTMGFAPVNVYAVWEINYWTISFDPNGGYFDGNTGNTSAVDKPVIKDNTINSEGAYETIEKASLVDTLGCQVYKCKDFKCKQAKCEVPKCQSFYCKVPKCKTFNCKTKKSNGTCKTYYTDADYQTEGYCAALYDDANTHTDKSGKLDRCYVLYTDNDYQTDGYCKTLYSDANTHTDRSGNLDRCYQQYTDADDNAAHCNAWYNTDTGDQCKTRYSVADGNDEEYCKTWNTKTSEYHFQGWNNDKNATTAIADLGKAKQDSTFYAVWTTDVLYSVNFITAYGTAPETQHVKTGTKATKPSDPTAKGYSFDGWVTTEGGSTAFNFNKNITEATNIYAKWIPNKHTVTFQVLSSIDSSVVSTETVTRTNQAFGSDVELVSKSMEGYTYSDWTSTSDGVTINGSSFKMPDNDVVLTCYRTPETYYLEWNLKNGTITSAPEAYTPEGDVPFGTTIYAPDVFREGYTFQGWTLNGIDTIAFPTTMPGEDVSYQALWKAKRYKIDYYVDGVLKKTVSDLAYNSTITPMDTSKVGYDFSGWTWYNGDTEIEAPSIIPDFDLKAKGTFTIHQYDVTFNLQGKGENLTAKVEYGSSAVEPSPAPTAEGFAFKGWFKEAACTNAWDFEAGKITTDSTIYAKWVPSHTITFTVDGSVDNTLTQVVAEGDEVTLTALSDKDAIHTFAGWTMVTDGVTITDGKFTMPAKDVEIAGGFNYTVTYTMDGNAYGEMETYPYGTEVTVKAKVDSTGYTVTDWTSAQVTDEDLAAGKFVLTGDVVINATSTINKYGITFANYDGAELQSGEVEYGTVPVYEGETPTKAATAKYTYTFKGWDVEPVAAVAAVTYTAQFDSTVNKYEITWKNYDNSVLAVDSVAYDETPSYGAKTPEKPATAEKTYTFIGWDPDVVAVTGDAVYTAQFTDVAVPYELVWDFAGGEATGEYTAAGEVLTGATLKYPTSVTKTGYDFAGWKPASVTVMPAENLTLTAQWTPVEYTITYYLDGGTNASGNPGIYTIESEDFSIAEPTKTGYTFEGWYSDEGLQTPATTTIAKGSMGGLDFYAKWTINQYTITFDTKGGSEVAPITQDYGTAVTAPADPTKDHYSFSGWDKAVPTTMPAESMTITAQWTPDEFSIIYVMNGGDEPADTYKKYAYDTTAAFALPSIATYSGWDFGGWFQEAAFTNGISALAAKTFGDTTVYAKFTKEVIADLGDIDGDGDNDTIHVVIDNNDTEDSVSVKTTEEAEDKVPPVVPANDSTGSDGYDYTFKEYQCDSAEAGADVDYTCKAIFDTTAHVYDIAYVMNGGDEPADEYKSYPYSETDDFLLPGTATYSSEEGWEFKGWFDDSTFAKSMPKIAAGTFGNDTVFAKFTKEIIADLGDIDGDGTNDTLHVVIDNNDTEDSVSVKTTEESDKRDPAVIPADTTKDPYDYTFKEYQCDSAEVGAAVDYTCKAIFDSTAHAYEIAYVMNGGDEPADEYKSYPYSETDDFSLPENATYSSEEGWEFKGWFDDSTFANSMTKIVAGTFGDTAVYAKFTKEVKADIGDVDGDGKNDTITVVIDNNDTEDSVSVKTTEEAKDNDPPMVPADSTKDPYDYTFKEYQCDSAEVGAAVDYTCKAVFDSTAKTYDIAYVMNGGDEPADTYKKYTYSETDAFALPSTATYSGWNFAGWYKEAAFANSMTELAAKTFGDTAVYAKFTKEVKADIGDVDGDGKNDTITVVIDNNDTEDSVSVKTTEEAKDNDPPMVPADSTKDPYDYTFKEYQCDSAEVGATVDYTCKAVFDSTAKTYNIAYVMNGGEQPADEYKTYTYSETDAFALPNDATYSGWNFAGWYKEAAFANSMTALAAKTFGDTTVYAKFTKEVKADIGDVDGDGKNDTITVVIDNNDTEDSVSVKTTEEAKDDDPPMVPADSTKDPYDYTFKEYQCDSAEVGAAVDYTCKAVFDSTAKTYDIAYVMNGGEQPADEYKTYTYSETNAFALPNSATYSGWNFAGWYKEAAFANSMTELAAKTFGDTTVYAKFTKEVIADLGDVDGDGTNDTIHVVIDNNDTEDSVSVKTTEEAEDKVPPVVPANDSTGSDGYDYTFKEYQCDSAEVGADVDYTCKAIFDTTAHTYEIVLDIPDSVQVDCDGITACVITATDTTVIHKYGEETKLPEAFVVDSTGNKDTTWEFQGWVDSDGDTITVIPDTAMADTLKPSFIKELDIIIVAEPDTDTVHVVIDNDDTQDSIETKVQEEAEKHVPPLPRDTVIVDTPYVYTYNDSIGFECEFVSATEMKCEAAYDTTAMDFEIVLDIPDSVQVDCDGITACVITATDTTVIHKYGEETILPEAFVVDSTGKKDTTWEFQGWVDSDGDTVTVIPDTAMADTLKPSFIKELDIIIVAEPDTDTVHVVIDNDDTQDSIETKVQEEAEKHVPPLPRDTVIVDTPYVYTYNDSIGFQCEFVSATEMKCEAAYDTTAMEFEIVLDIPDSVQVDCDGITACVITATDTTVIHKYGEETKLPEAFIVDSTGKKDTTWDFNGWVNTNGDTVKVIPADAYADTLKPDFTKEIKVVIGDDTLIVVIDPDDTQDSIDTKVTEEAENHVPPIVPNPTTYTDTPYVYEYKGYECEPTEKIDVYECKAVYDSTGMDFEVVLVVPDTAIVDCDGVEACRITTDSTTGLPIDTTVVHKYGEETILPEAHVIDADGKIDSTWEFAGWFDNDDGQGDTVKVIPAEAYGDTLYPFFTKEIEVIIGDDTITVVIDQNDTQDSINTKVKEEAENHVPPIVPNPSKYTEPPYEYTYNGYDCEPAGKDVYVCEATYDSVKVGAQYKIVYMMPKAAVLSKNIKSYTEGVGTILPTASLKGTDGWQFMGWYVDERFVGTRVQEIKASEKGKKVFYPMFQKALTYSTRDGSGEISVIYNEAELDMVERTLAGVIPADYTEGGITYTFDKWYEKDNHFTAQYVDKSKKPEGGNGAGEEGKTGLANRAIAKFQVMVSGRTLEISGARMGAKIAVYGMDGRLVTQGVVENGTTRVELTKAGSYVVRVNNQYSRVNVR